MKRWFKWFLTSVFIVMISTVVEAQTTSIGRDTGLNFGKYEVDRVSFYDSFNVGDDVGTHTAQFYVYNSTSGTFGTDTVTGGEVKTLKYTEGISIGIGVGVLGSVSIDWRIEGRYGTDSQFAQVGTGTISTATTIDVLTTVTSNPESIRVGLKANGVQGTDEVDVYGLFRAFK